MHTHLPPTHPAFSGQFVGAGWATDRSFLTGYFLVEEAAEAPRVERPPAQLDIYPAEIQESLRASTGAGAGAAAGAETRCLCFAVHTGPRTQPSARHIRAVVDGLLSAFSGLSGEFVGARVVEEVGGRALRYEIVSRGQIEPDLQEMAGRMLPIGCDRHAATGGVLARARRMQSLWRCSGGEICNARPVRS